MLRPYTCTLLNRRLFIYVSDDVFSRGMLEIRASGKSLVVTEYSTLVGYYLMVAHTLLLHNGEAHVGCCVVTVYTWVNVMVLQSEILNNYGIVMGCYILASAL